METNRIYEVFVNDYFWLYDTEPIAWEDAKKEVSHGGSLIITKDQPPVVAIYLKKQEYYRQRDKQWEKERAYRNSMHNIVLQRRKIGFLVKRLDTLVGIEPYQRKTAADSYQETITKLRQHANQLSPD